MKNYIYISVLALSSISISALSQRVSNPANASVRISWQNGQAQRPSYRPNQNSYHRENRRCCNDHDPYQEPYYNRHSEYYNQNYVRGMGDPQFNGLISQIHRSYFDSDRLIIAKQAIRAQGIYSDQVLKVMKEMSFESSRMELAQFAYGFCVDYENYYIVNDGFQFSSSIRELNEFIYQ
jgi:Domain of unknown function (DUF4476)